MLFFDVADQQVAQDWARQQGGVEAEWLAPSAARQVESAVAADLGPALWMPGVAQIRNPRLLAALTAELRQSGVEFRQNCTVRGFLSKGGSLTGIRTSAGDIATTRCVVAAGAWSAQLLAQTGLALPVRPVKGQMLLFYAPSLELKRILIKDGHYVIPRLDGHILTGSTLEETGFDKSTTPGAFEELREAAIHLAPGLAAAPVVRHWAGLRPGSPEGIPFIGPHPAIAGLYVCTGHFRYGIVLGPASARLLVDCALDREPLIDLGQFLPPTA
jgi:glycine oxidase